MCQAALSDAVERVGRTRRTIAALRHPATPVATLRQIGEGRAAAILSGHGVQPSALRRAIEGAAAGVAHERLALADRSARGLADLTRRLEAVERQLAAAPSGP